MKIVFLVIAHKEFGILRQLVDSLRHPDVDIIIHFDKKSEIDIEHFTMLVEENDNLYYLEDRVSIIWGGPGLLDAQLRLLQTAVAVKKYDYFSFISGQDLLIKPIEYVLGFLNDNIGYEFIEYFAMPNFDRWASGGLDRINYSWFIDEVGMEKALMLYELQKRNGKVSDFPFNLKLYGGSNWMTLTGKCVSIIITFILSNRKYLDFFRLSLLPEEICFQTIIANSQGDLKIVNDNLRFIDWKSSGTLPKILQSCDSARLATTNAHFARKFDSTIDQNIINWVKQLSGGST